MFSYLFRKHFKILLLCARLCTSSKHSERDKICLFLKRFEDTQIDSHDQDYDTVRERLQALQHQDTDLAPVDLATSHGIISFHSLLQTKPSCLVLLADPMPLFLLSFLPRMSFTHLPTPDFSTSSSFSKTLLGCHLLLGVFSKSLIPKEGWKLCLRSGEPLKGMNGKGCG